MPIPVRFEGKVVGTVVAPILLKWGIIAPDGSPQEAALLARVADKVVFTVEFIQGGRARVSLYSHCTNPVWSIITGSGRSLPDHSRGV